MGLTSALARAAQVRGSHTALVYGDRRLTWSELEKRVPRIAGGLTRLGLIPGERVAVLSLNNDLYAELFLAVPYAGGVIVPLNTRWSEVELVKVIDDCEPRILAVDDACLAIGQALARHRPSLTLLFIGHRAPGHIQNYGALVECPPIADHGVTGDDLYAIFYTGGTTGRSKGVMLSHRNVLRGAAIAHSEGYYGEEAIYLVAAPFFHASGSWPLVAVTASAATVVILPSFSAEGALAAIEKHRVTESLFVPTMLQMLIEHPKFKSTDLSSFQTIVYGGSPITSALLDRAVSALPNTQFIQAYGMTELAQCAALHHKYLNGEYRTRGTHRAAGRTCYGLEIRIVDEHDNVVPAGQVGEICVRGETVMLGYWRRPEETQAAIRDGWMHTGDGGRFDEDGFLHVVDRVKDMIITGGENVFSLEVEDALAQHPAVRECIVIGIPSGKWVEQVHAIVILHHGARTTEESLIAHARSLLAGYKIPRSVEFRTDDFPKSSANKILKGQIREAYWAGRPSRIS